MQVLGILWRNARHASRTRRPLERVPVPEGFRGALSHEAAACAGCGTCSYVCSPAAITLQRRPDGLADWRYFAGQCTFCGRCAEFCATGAIRLGAQGPPVTRDQSIHRVSHEVASRPCARCGGPLVPLPAATLAPRASDAGRSALEARPLLCGRCRQRVAAEAIKRGMRGTQAGGTP